MSLLDPRAVRDWCKKSFLDKDSVLKTKEAIEANTEEGKTADALVVKEVFQSVSDGKQLIASAITDKGIETDATAAFGTMAENIGKIEGGGGGGDSVLESPYLFEVYFVGSYVNLYLEDNRSYFPIKKVKRLVVKSLNMSAQVKTSGASVIYFYIYGKNASGVATRLWYKSVASGNTSSVEDYEVTIPEGYEIDYVTVYKSSATGTGTMHYYNIKGQIELYF